MPKRTDIKTILIIGAGPIVIGQACEFDYSGAQACKALREEGYRVVLVNSNPATIMTDPEMADSIYIEPVEWRTVARIIEKERPDALLPTMGGQTALNCSLDLVRKGVLEKFGVEMIGASREAIDMAEDRDLFRQAMAEIGLDTPQAELAHSLEGALDSLERIGFPTIIRPSFTMGGSGGGIAYNREEFVEIVKRGLEQSPTSEVLLEVSVLGWKEYEMEVVRDHEDNCIIICSIENLDPMGIHTGDSITVAPALTLTDKEYQRLRDASIAVLRKIGVDTGGSNVQFAVNPDDGRVIIIEMNPRVSRSSALMPSLKASPTYNKRSAPASRNSRFNLGVRSSESPAVRIGLKPSRPVSRLRRAFCKDSWKVRPMAMTSPTDFICVVRRSLAAGNFSNAKRGILVTT
jgi:carbamoyl-phosphate synthase large subunit